MPESFTQRQRQRQRQLARAGDTSSFVPSVDSARSSAVATAGAGRASLSSPPPLPLPPGWLPEFVSERDASQTALEAAFADHQRRLAQLFGPRLAHVCLWDVPEAEGVAHVQAWLRAAA